MKKTSADSCDYCSSRPSWRDAWRRVSRLPVSPSPATTSTHLWPTCSVPTMTSSWRNSAPLWRKRRWESLTRCTRCRWRTFCVTRVTSRPIHQSGRLTSSTFELGLHFSVCSVLSMHSTTATTKSSHKRLPDLVCVKWTTKCIDWMQCRHGQKTSVLWFLLFIVCLAGWLYVCLSLSLSLCLCNK